MKYAYLVTERVELTNRIKIAMLTMVTELHDLRKNTFTLMHDGTTDVYGKLAKNFTIDDRDYYIKSLSNYYDIILQLAEGSDDENNNINNQSNPFSNEQTLAIRTLGYNADTYHSIKLHHSDPVYGDLSAMSHLKKDLPAQVPDFKYNKGEE